VVLHRHVRIAFFRKVTVAIRDSNNWVNLKRAIGAFGIYKFNIDELYCYCNEFPNHSFY
jgi:hypothetical protein